MSVQIASAQELIPKAGGLRPLFMDQNWSTGILFATGRIRPLCGPVGKTGVSPGYHYRMLHCPIGGIDTTSRVIPSRGDGEEPRNCKLRLLPAGKPALHLRGPSARFASLRMTMLGAPS